MSGDNKAKKSNAPRAAKPRSSADPFTKDERAAIMRAVKSADTGPERTLRKALFARGYRYRLNVRTLPGSPDLVFPGRRSVVFVHGCFWHGHDCPRGARAPKTNADYWRAKIARNVARDGENLKALTARGWRALIVWECALKNLDAEAARVAQWLDDAPRD